MFTDQEVKRFLGSFALPAFAEILTFERKRGIMLKSTRFDYKTEPQFKPSSKMPSTWFLTGGSMKTL